MYETITVIHRGCPLATNRERTTTFHTRIKITEGYAQETVTCPACREAVRADDETTEVD